MFYNVKNKGDCEMKKIAIEKDGLLLRYIKKKK